MEDTIWGIVTFIISFYNASRHHHTLFCSYSGGHAGQSRQTETCLAKLYQISEHYDASASLLPHHPPKIINSLLQGTLCCDVLLGITTLRTKREKERERENKTKKRILHKCGS